MSSPVHPHPVYPAAAREGCDGARVPVAIVGAGPVGLALAIDLAQQGVAVLLLDDDDTVSVGSRAICWSKRTLEIFDRLGCGEAIVARGVRWQTGRVFFGDSQVFEFDLAPEPGYRRPAFINLQQYHVEQLLVQRAMSLPQCTLRWKHCCERVTADGNIVRVDVATPEGPYTLQCDWLVACDGAHSSVRRALGLESCGRVFNDRFLIADIRMRSSFPAERWFWFDPPFHRGQSALLHRQADDVWRLDFQLGADADVEAERQPDKVRARVRAMLGDDVEFTIEWASVYTFQCRRIDRFRHDRVLFAGDAAHVVSPFGARGANSGVQDADNLGWKLACVIRGQSPSALLDSYDAERSAAADENIRHSTRSTDFISPKSPMSRTYRDCVLDLARRYPFARQWVNSGRLSVASQLRTSPLNTTDTGFDVSPHATAPGAVAADALLADNQWLLDHLGGRFVLLSFDAAMAPHDVRRLRERDCDVLVIVKRSAAVSFQPPLAGSATSNAVDSTAAAGTVSTTLVDFDGLATQRYDALPGTCYLVRPDQYICARWHAFDAQAVLAAIERACGHG